MFRFSGLVLDQYDAPPDLSGENELVKQAFDQSAVASLPSHLFALVIHEGRHELRKFACHDEINTALAIRAFSENHHKLPQEVQQKVAQNLTIACGWYDLPVPEVLEKIALGLGTALTLGSTALAAPGVIKETGRRLAQNKQTGGAVLGAAERAFA